jgi:hypothetical protein
MDDRAQHHKVLLAMACSDMQSINLHCKHTLQLWQCMQCSVMWCDDVAWCNCVQVRRTVRRCGRAGSGAGHAAWWALCAQPGTHHWCVRACVLKRSCSLIIGAFVLVL